MIHMRLLENMMKTQILLFLINSLLGQTPKLGVCTIKSELFPRK